MPTDHLVPARPLLRIDPATGALRQLRYEVAVVSGPDAGKVAPLRGVLVIGTDPEADLSLSDTTVSRQHVQLQPRAEGVLVRDMGSTNGTFVASARIERALLTGADASLSIGKTTLRITVRDEDAAPEERSSFGSAVGESPSMRRVFGILARVAASDSTILMTGETGTGKDVLARAVHAASPRRDQPFVTVDCAAISPALIESELFGHVRGAFTGAVAHRVGAFTAAHGGTIFLDEIGEMPLELQPKLLRVLESRTVKPIGDDRTRVVDVRVVAATHRDLEARMRAGQFREDLLFRLSVVPVRVPPLRERMEDIPLLVRHFLREWGRDDFPVPENVLAQMRAHSWTGNVRELKNLVARAVALGVDVGEALSDRSGESAAASWAADEPLPYKEAKERLVHSFTRSYLADLAERHEGNISQMARAAGIARHYLRELMVRHGLRGED